MRLGAALAIALVGCGGFLGITGDDPPASTTPPVVDGGEAGAGVATGSGENEGGASDASDAASENTINPCTNDACERRVFVTTDAYGGDLGGVDGADLKCQLAGDLFLPGRQWKAWVSTLTNSVNKRFSSFTGPYVTGDPPVAVASTWNGFASDTHLAPIVTESGAAPSNGELVWTGTSPSGNEIGSDCDGWTSSLFSAAGVAGTASALGERWSNTGAFDCNNKLHLYCVEQ